MLKIKDSVDFKILKKFGFVDKKNYNYYEYCNGEGTKYYIFKHNRKVQIYNDKIANANYSLDKIYELVQADLIEKEE